MFIRRYAAMYSLRRRIARAQDSNKHCAGIPLDATGDMGQVIDKFSALVGIFPGLGSYWEAFVIIEGERKVIRSYRLSSLVDEVIKHLLQYERDNG